MAMALRPRERPASIVSREGAQALADGLWPGFGSAVVGALAANSAPKSVVTTMAGFAQAGSSSPAANGFPPPESVITSMAGFAGAARPQLPGGRSTIPASFK